MNVSARTSSRVCTLRSVTTVQASTRPFVHAGTSRRTQVCSCKAHRDHYSPCTCSCDHGGGD